MAVLHEWLTVAAVAAHFQICTRTVRNWIKHGKLRATRAGEILRVDRAEVRRFEHEVFAPTDIKTKALSARQKRAEKAPRGKDGRFRKDPRNSKRLPRNVTTGD